jgi:hypothetical protein
MTRMNPAQQEERTSFVLSRLKRGFSIKETQKLFRDNYRCSDDTARRWVDHAIRQENQKDSVDLRSQHRTVAMAILHDLILSHQSDIAMIATDLKRIKDAEDRRTEIYKLLPTAKRRTKANLQKELKELPIPPLSVKLQLLSAKDRIRSAMQRPINDLLRLQGVNAPQSNWRNALFTLLDNNLVSPNVAESILTMIDDFEQSVRSVEEVSAEPTEPEGIEDLLEEIPM